MILCYNFCLLFLLCETITAPAHIRCQHLCKGAVKLCAIRLSGTPKDSCKEQNILSLSFCNIDSRSFFTRQIVESFYLRSLKMFVLHRTKEMIPFVNHQLDLQQKNLACSKNAEKKSFSSIYVNHHTFCQSVGLENMQRRFFSSYIVFLAFAFCDWQVMHKVSTSD